jgi:dienelactone hydrolase
MTEPQHTRQAFVRLLERARTPLEPETALLQSPALGVRAESFNITSEAGQRVSGLVLQDEEARSMARPAVIVAHGTGGSKEAVLPLLLTLAARGFVAVAIDARHHGQRVGGPDAGSAAYVTAIFDKFRGASGYPFLYDTVWDLMRTLDYLEQRPDIDAQRIGLLGISKGGMETYLTAAADPRIAATVPVLGVQSYAYALEQELWRPRVETFQSAFDAAAQHAGVAAPDAAFVRHFYDRVVPGIYGEFDGPAMLPCIAPRPLLVVNGELDARTAGLHLCQAAAEAAYAQGGAPEAFSLHVQAQTGHEFTECATQRAIGWLERWLKR